MEHLRIIRIIDYISGGVSVLVGFGLIVTFFLGAGLVEFLGQGDEKVRTILAIVFGTVGLIAGAVLVLLGLLSVMAGMALCNLQVWSRIFHIVVAILNIPNVPIGTAIGIYVLWVLLVNEQTRALFDRAGS